VAHLQACNGLTCCFRSSIRKPTWPARHREKTATAAFDPDLPSQDTYLVKHKISEPKQLVEAGNGLRADFREWPLLEDEPPFLSGYQLATRNALLASPYLIF
jgi:hypothetical protein